MSTRVLTGSCEGAIVSYLRWPSGGAGQAVLSFVRALPQYRHVVLFYEVNSAWGLSAQPLWLVAALRAHAEVHTLRPLLAADTGDDVSYDRYCSHFGGIEYFWPVIAAGATHFVHHWVSRDRGAPAVAPQCRRICVLHGRASAPHDYDRYVCPCRFALQVHPELAGHSVSVIHNAIDCSFWSRERPPLGLRTVGRVSALHRSKFPANYIYRVRPLLHALSAVTHVIVGAGPAQEELGADVAALDCSHRVVLAGEYVGAALRDVVHSFDVFLYFTGDHIEFHPFVLLEAIASGVPVVTEPRGGIPEIVTDGHNGFLCSDLEVGIERICDLAHDSTMMANLGVSTAHSAARWSLQAHGEAWAGILE